MKRHLAIVLLLTVVGCAHYSPELVHEKYGCEIGAEELQWFANAGVTRNTVPKLKTAYEYKGHSNMEVVRSTPSGYLVKQYFAFDWHVGLPLLIETSDELVDGESLKQGLYEFVGVEEFPDSDGSRLKVRKFRKLDVKKE